MSSETFESRYRGGFAQDYDTGRETSARWRTEAQVFTELLARAAPRSVIDCPFGTGRWIDWYKDLEGPVFGLDKSADMLAQARAKIDAGDGRFHLSQADIFGYDFGAHEGLDLVVNTRFLNWVPAGMAGRVLAQLARVRPRHAIIGCSVIPEGAPLPRRLRMRRALWIKNLKDRLKGGPAQYVHDEAQVLRWFAAAGWSVIERRPIFQSPSRENFFYLLSGH